MTARYTEIFNAFLSAGRLTIDYRSRLFWATDFADVDANSRIVAVPYHIDDLIPHELYPPMLLQTQTGEVPVAMHFNHRKDLMDAWWGKLWWNKLQDDADARFKDIVSRRMEGAVVKFAGLDSRKWKDLCPTEFTGI